MEQVNLVNDDKANKVSIAGISTLASDNVPFFWCGDDNVICCLVI